MSIGWSKELILIDSTTKKAGLIRLPEIKSPKLSPFIYSSMEKSLCQDAYGTLRKDGQAASSGVVRNCLENLLWEFYESYLKCSLLEDEIKAYSRVLKICYQHGYKKVWAEFDTKTQKQSTVASTIWPRVHLSDAISIRNQNHTHMVADWIANVT